MRRTVLSLVILLVSALSHAGNAAERPQHPLACPEFSDPVADDRNADLRWGEDPALDIVGARLSVRSARLVVELHMKELGEPTYAEGVQYAGGFRYGKKDVELFGTVAWSNDWTRSFLALQGIRVDHSYVLDTNAQVTMTLDQARRTVILSASVADLSKALDERLQGTGHDVRATTAGNFVVFGEPYDRATTQATLRLAGCR